MEHIEILELAMTGVLRQMDYEPERKEELEEKLMVLARMIAELRYQD